MENNTRPTYHSLVPFPHSPSESRQAKIKEEVFETVPRSKFVFKPRPQAVCNHPKAQDRDITIFISRPLPAVQGCLAGSRDGACQGLLVLSGCSNSVLCPLNLRDY